MVIEAYSMVAGMSSSLPGGPYAWSASVAGKLQALFQKCRAESRLKLSEDLEAPRKILSQKTFERRNDDSCFFL